MSRVFDVLFNDGQDESADKIALPDGKFRLMQNCRLTRDGRVEPRQNYVSLTNVTAISPAARFRAFDLTTYQDRLIALGTADSISSTPTYAQQIHTYVDNAQHVWLPHAGPNIPPMFSATRIWQSTTGLIADSMDLAYANGQICVVQADGTLNQVTAVRLKTDGTVLSTETFSAAFVSTTNSARVVACGNTFVMVIRNTSGDMVARSFDTTGTAVVFGSPTTLEAGVATGSVAWDLAPLAGTTDFLVSYPRVAAGNTRLRRYSVAFALANTFDIAGVLGATAIVSTDTEVVYAIANGNDVELRTLSTALALTVGPTDVLGAAVSMGNVSGPPAIGLISATRVTVYAPSLGTLGDLNNLWSVRSIAAHTLVTSGTTTNVRIQSKPIVIDRNSTSGECYAVGTLPAGGNEASTIRFFSSAMCGVEFSPGVTAAAWNYQTSAPMAVVATGFNTAGRPSVATDGAGTYYVLSCRQSGLNIGAAGAEGSLLVMAVNMATATRRQTAEMQGALYVAGGVTYMFDGGLNSAECGFLDVPVIDATVSQGAGSLTLLADYTYVATYEYTDSNGFLHRSTPSDPQTTTLTGGNQGLTHTVSAPHSFRRANFTQNAGVLVVLWRTTPGDSIFYRVAETTVLNTTTPFGVVSIADTRSDIDAQTREVLYTFAQKPTANVSPQPNRFVAAGRDRLIFGGLPDPYEVALSQLAFRGEPIESASPNAFAYVARLPEPCTGVTAVGDAYVAFTADAIYTIPGAGPQRNGTGEFFSPQAIYSDGGCIDWRSIVECGKGTFFQLDTDKLFLLGSQGGATWVGQPVRDTLASYPVIVGSCLCSATQRVVFACTNAAASDGVLLVYDLRRETWSVDNIGASVAVVEHDGRLAYVGTDGLVYLENLPGVYSGALPSVSIRTGSFKLFPANGNGDLIKVILSGTYVGDSTVEAFISYDDGKNWISMGQQLATTANLFNCSPASGAAVVTGDAVTVVWTPNIRQVTRFALRFDITNGTDNGGLWAHMVSLEVEAQEFATRQPARNQR